MTCCALILTSEILGAQTGSVRAQQEDAWSKQGLKAAADIAGSFTSSVKYPESGLPAYLDELVDLSEVIIVGRATSNVCRLNRDGDSIVTQYTVMSDKVLKGKIEQGTSIVVALLGGRVTFSNGSWAELTPSNLLLPDTNRAALWFLRRVSRPFEAEAPFTPTRSFVLTAGPLGLYDLSGQFQRRTFVLPAGAFKTELGMRIYRERLTPDAFVERVSAIVASPKNK